MTPLQQSIMLSSIIGSLLANYDHTKPKERLKPITILKARIKKFMYKRSRTNTKEFSEAIDKANIAWRNSVNHFAEQDISIEVVSTIIRLYDLYSDVISKYANIHEKQMESFAQGQTESVTEEIELKSYEVSDFILEELAIFTNKRRKKLNLLLS